MLKADLHFHYGRLLWAHKKMFEEPNKDKKNKISYSTFCFSFLYFIQLSCLFVIRFNFFSLVAKRLIKFKKTADI